MAGDGVSVYMVMQKWGKGTADICVLTTKIRAAKACCVRVGSGFVNSHNQ